MEKLTTNSAQMLKLQEALAQRTAQLQILNQEVIEIRTEVTEKNRIIDDYETIVQSLTSRKIKEVQFLKDELSYKNTVIKKQQEVIDRLVRKLRKLDCILPPNLLENTEQIRRDVTSTRGRAQGISAEPSNYQKFGKQTTNIQKFFYPKSPGYEYTVCDNFVSKFVHE